MAGNENQETLQGVVENVVFHNEVNGFTVLEINANGEVLTCVGSAADISPGEEVVFTGSWDSHTLFGRQFKFTACRRSMPDTSAKLFRYLASGAIKGIGESLAARIIKTFGDDTLRILDEEPERLAEVKGISERMAREISAQTREKQEVRGAMMAAPTF